MTPDQVHYGQADEIHAARQNTLDAAFSFSRIPPSHPWWQTTAGWKALSRPSAAEGGGRRPAFTGLAAQPNSATEVDGWLLRDRFPRHSRRVCLAGNTTAEN